MDQPPKSLPPAKWYSLADDSFTQLLINPWLPQWRVVGAPEYVSLATSSFTTSGEEIWSARVQEPACCAVRLTRQGGALELWEGDVISFNGQAFARLVSMGRPYWRQAEFPPKSVGFYSGRLNILLSYCQLQFVDATRLTRDEVASALVLRPTSVDFG